MYTVQGILMSCLHVAPCVVLVCGDLWLIYVDLPKRFDRLAKDCRYKSQESDFTAARWNDKVELMAITLTSTYIEVMQLLQQRSNSKGPAT